MFLLTTRLAAWLRLARREERWKTAEILILRHQLAVLQRRQPRRPRLDWADRALLATLLAVIPKARRHGLDDLFPGSGAVGRAWAAYTGGGDPSLPAAADASCKARAARRVRPRAMCCFRPGRTRRLRRRVTRKAQIWAEPSSTPAVRRVVQAAGNTSGTAYACAVCPAGYPHRAGDGLRPVRAGSRLPLGLWPMPAARE